MGWAEGVIVLLIFFGMGAVTGIAALLYGFNLGLKTARDVCEKLHGPVIDQGD